MPVEIPEGYRPSEDEPYMNPMQVEYFRRELVERRRQVLEESREVFVKPEEKDTREIDSVDQGKAESDRTVQLKNKDRYRKLVRKIDAALQRIGDGTYGYCEETGKEIGIRRLEAGPIASLCIEAQERRERTEKLGLYKLLK